MGLLPSQNERQLFESRQASPQLITFPHTSCVGNTAALLKRDAGGSTFIAIFFRACRSPSHRLVSDFTRAKLSPFPSYHWEFLAGQNSFSNRFEQNNFGNLLSLLLPKVTQPRRILPPIG
jgi:hypothetical protein